MDFDHATPSAPHQYLGNRVRFWDVADSLHGILRAALQDSSRVIALPESRLISKVLADLESHGFITQVPAYEPPSTCLIIMQGVDGLDDLYFDYDLGVSLGATCNLQVPQGPTRILSHFTGTK